MSEVTNENCATAINLLLMIMSIAGRDWMVIYGVVAINFITISWPGCISSRKQYLINKEFFFLKPVDHNCFTTSAKEVEKSCKSHVEYCIDCR